MSDELSTEAAVAGEAAAAAVQEVQSRESVTEAASEAVNVALIAEDSAETARELATDAAISAGESRETSEIAVETAVTAQSMAAETHESLSGLAERFESRFTDLESKWETVLNALQNATEKPTENSETDVTEVPVNDNTEANSSSDGTESGGDTGEPSANSGAGRRRIVGRHR